MDAGILPACISMHHIVQCPRKPGEDLGSPGTRVTDSSELPCGCWEFNLGPLEKQLVLTADLSLWFTFASSETHFLLCVFHFSQLLGDIKINLSKSSEMGSIGSKFMPIYGI